MTKLKYRISTGKESHQVSIPDSQGFETTSDEEPYGDDTKCAFIAFLRSVVAHYSCSFLIGTAQVAYKPSQHFSSRKEGTEAPEYTKMWELWFTHGR